VLSSFRRLAPTLILAALGFAAPLYAKPSDSLTRDLQGPWTTNGEEFLYFHGDQIFLFENHKLVVRGLVRFQAGALVVRNEGKLETWHASLQNHHLKLGMQGDARVYRRLDRVPPQVSLEPFKLGRPQLLSPERIKAIQDEMDRRWKRDQEVRTDPAQRAQAAAVDEDNRRYFLGLLREVGWPDVARFGTRTSVYAAAFVKHFGDLSVTLAALPYIERDLKDTGEGQMFAIVYDDTQLHLGRKQRYGTQIDEDAQGNPYVLPLEQPDKVDERLKAIGQPPLASYLADASKALYDGKPIRLPTPEESQ
jgi:hypothetical protein